MPNEILEKLKPLAEKIAKHKNSNFKEIELEAHTSSEFVEPFLKALGYDKGISVLKREYKVLEIDGNNVVDYAILNNGAPLAIVEVKHHSVDLDSKKPNNNPQGQLNRYFGACVKGGCKFGILTNGLEYRFFADTQKPNTMDSTPFMILNLESLPLESNINDDEVAILELFRYENLQNNITQIRNRAESMLDKIAIKIFLKTNIIKPSDEFAKFVLKHIKGTQHTKKASEFKAHITRIFGEIMANKANIPLCETQDFETQKNENPLNDKERQAFNIVCEILANEIMTNGVNLTLGKRTTNYIPVEIEGGKYICGIWNNCSAISIPNKEHKFGYERFKIENINDIYKYKNELIKSLKIRLK